ncbi:hypothetical protein [Chryseobacterium gambrini]|uniref:hypothetical protein n=1 Tax=Chryseobacterium gambrini TaxID=373672 RepID=UPI003BA7C09C
MKKFLFIFLLGFSCILSAQIITSKEDIKDKVDVFEVWAFIKPFTMKECYFINYGQKKFRPNNYDLVGQGIFDKDNRKFEKGEWLQLVQYLKSQGFEKKEERPGYIGDITGRVITFEKIK